MSELEQRNTIPQQTAWFKEVPEFLTPSAETFSSGSPAQVRLVLASPPTGAGPPANPYVVPDLNGLRSTAMQKHGAGAGLLELSIGGGMI